MAAMTFRLFVISRAGARNAGEVGSRLRVAALSGGKFSEVCARCTSGRRCTTSVTATEVGRGGRGTFGGGTGGGLRSARRGLKSGVSAKERDGGQGPLLLTALHRPCFRSENVHRLLFSELARVLPHRYTLGQPGRYLYCRCARGHRDS
jgi:hypothetical protein